MKLPSTLFGALALLGVAVAQKAGTNTAEVHPSMPSQTCTSAGCTTESTSIVIDANWRWTYKVGTSTNCYTGNKWDTSICPDGKTCASSCALDGASYQQTYGISTSNGQVSMGFVTHGPYSTNVGSRIYMMQDDTHYKMFKLLNKEFAFDVDVSTLECGLNGALYFVSMDADGGLSKFSSNTAGAKYGTGYCDAQCPRDVKFINGEANCESWVPSKTDVNGGTGSHGSCCPELDIWEANKISNAFTSHPCSVDEQTRCDGDSGCGSGSDNRYKGLCDRDGCDFNPYRMGNHTFYGPGSGFAVDTTKPMTVVTQFITDDNTDNGNLVAIKRYFKQNDVVLANSETNLEGVTTTNGISEEMCVAAKKLFGNTDDHSAKGGLKQMGAAMKKGMVLTMSLWDDHDVNCLWLDSSYPADKDASTPGVARGTCPVTSGNPTDVEAKYGSSANVKFGNVKVGALGTTTKGVPAGDSATTNPTPTQTSTTKPTTTKPSTTTPSPTQTTTSAPATTQPVTDAPASTEPSTTAAPATSGPATTKPSRTTKPPKTTRPPKSTTPPKTTTPATTAVPATTTADPATTTPAATTSSPSDGKASNGVAYCVSPKTADPDGDGYGWENNAACVVKGSDADPPAQFTKTSSGYYYCEHPKSAHVDGDGYGWEFNHRCVAKGSFADPPAEIKKASNGIYFCVNAKHADPDNDGWGWEFDHLCVVEGSKADPSGAGTVAPADY